MKQSISHILISITLIGSLLIPLSIDFTQVLNKHEHKTCKAVNEKHIHKQKLACSHLYYVSFSKFKNKDFDLKLFIPLFIHSDQYEFDKPFLSNTSSAILDRGPPKFVFTYIIL